MVFNECIVFTKIKHKCNFSSKQAVLCLCCIHSKMVNGFHIPLYVAIDLKQIYISIDLIHSHSLVNR